MSATESRWPPQVSGAQKSDSPPSPPLQQDCHCHTFQPPVENHKTEPPQKYSFQLGQCFSGSKKPSLCSTDNFLRGKIFPKFWPIKISFNKMLSAHHLSILQTHLLAPLSNWKTNGAEKEERHKPTWSDGLGHPDWQPLNFSNLEASEPRPTCRLLASLTDKVY